MRISESIRSQLALKFEVLFPHLDERQRRLLMATEARLLGHGGIRAVARVAGVSETTVRNGVDELESGAEPLGRVRRPGGGRKKAVATDQGLRPALLDLVEPDERGDPMSPLRWTTKSTRRLADELTRQGHRVSADTVGDLLREEGFSLQAKQHIDAGDPVVSVDAKKKELVGEYKNTGRMWRPEGEPVKVKTHDFLDRQGPGKAIPYGIYDIAANTGWVNVGIDHDTAAFAVASIRRWWQARGRHGYPGAHRLLITADAGGSNGHRTRAWKTELAALAAETGLEITVCHMPPGTSKWNRIEHRLFSHISMNWRGRPLTSHDIIVNSIAATTTRTGLRVEAALDTDTYDTGVKVTDAQIDALPMDRHYFHGDWNYTLHPCPTPAAMGRTEPIQGDEAPGPADTTALRHPELIGMTRQKLDALIAELLPALEDLRERTRNGRRGADRRRAPGAGAKDKLPPADRILATLLHLRKLGTQDLLGQLFAVNRSTITRAVEEVRPLLDRHGHHITASTARFRTPADVTAFLTKIKPPC